MQQPPTSPSNGDGNEDERKTKLLALLDRARINRGLQPEERSDEAMDNAYPPIKAEPALVISAKLPSSHQKPQCTCSHNHQSSTTPTDAHSRIQHENQTFVAVKQGTLASNDTSMASKDDSSVQTTVIVRSSPQSRNNSSMETQTAGESAGQDDSKDGKVWSKDSTASGPAQLQVALLSSRPKPRIADLTGGNKTSRLQQLKPLGVPRKSTQQLHPEPLEEKVSTLREAPSRAQQKQPQKHHSPVLNTADTLKTLARLSVDDYEDSELHGDFQHMLHILIPSNATNALLERRGQPIQSISQQTDCTLSIREPEASPFKDDRLLRIYGKAKCISLAQRLVIACIRAYRAEKRDPNYMDLSDETPPVALPATSITKAMSVAIASGKKEELEITNPFYWMVRSENVGKMMGKQGSILASIRQSTGAAIHLDIDVVPGTIERRAILTGSIKSIAAAVKEIKSRAGGHPEVAASVTYGRLGQYFAIPYHAAGFLIGPQGSTVKQITERTGARLQIPSAEDLPLGSVNRILHMQGTPKQVEHAHRVVTAKLRDYLASLKYPRALAPVSTGRKGDKVTIKVLLPSRICGFMLDHRGKLVREISDKSGAYTFFLPPHDDENRICVFTGDMSCVLRAQRLVLQVIAGDAILSKRIVPPRKRKRSNRDEEEDYEVAEEEEAEFMEDQVSYYDGEVEEEDYEERFPVRRQPVRRGLVRRPQHNYDYENYHEEDRYTNDNMKGLDEAEFRDDRPRQPRRRPASTRSREYIEDDYEVDEYDHDTEEQMNYSIARSRVPKRQAVRRQTFTVRQEDSDDDFEEEDEYVYSDNGDNEYQLVTKQVVRRRPVSSRDGPRQAIVRPGRKVQMVAPRSSPREGRPRMLPIDRRRTNDTSITRPNYRNGSGDTRRGRGASRGGRGNGRPPSSRGRGNKRRRQ